MSALLGLFVAAFLAATLLPAQSEAVLAWMVASGDHPATLLWAVATIGNVAGAWVNWLLGRGLMRWRTHPRFPFSEEAIVKAQTRYRRWGWWSLWLSWVPIIGDPLTLVAGTMREPMWRFLCVVSAAKGLRYLVLIGVMANQVR